MPKSRTLGRPQHWVGGAVLALLAGCRPAPTPTASAAPSAYTVIGLYVLPSDGRDEGFATDGTLARSISAMRAWMTNQTSGQDLRWSSAPPAVVRVGERDAQIASKGPFVRDELEALLAKQGYRDSHAVYAVWYGGSSTYSCGGGAWPPALGGHVAALYLHGAYGSVDCSKDRFSGDGVRMEIHEFGMLHEIMHTLGYVPKCAPHHTRAGHSSDSTSDLMYAGDAPWAPSVLDPGHDDYYLTGRTACPDLSRSVFLVPTSAAPEAPPAWK
jgi:hypothetical protein